MQSKNIKFQDFFEVISGQDESNILKNLQKAAETLEFEKCVYWRRFSQSISDQENIVWTTYPEKWRHKYEEENYIYIDPSVAAGSKTNKPIIWTQKLKKIEPEFWEEAACFGLNQGVSLSCWEGSQMVGMLSLSRSHDDLSPMFIRELAADLISLVSTVHVCATHEIIKQKIENLNLQPLTNREKEVLKWSADGKSADDISAILGITPSTANFHLRNAILKLHCPNKTSAVVRALILNLI